MKRANDVLTSIWNGASWLADNLGPWGLLGLGFFDVLLWITVTK